MSRAQFATELRTGIAGLSDTSLRNELVGLLPEGEFAGLATRLRASFTGLADLIAGD